MGDPVVAGMAGRLSARDRQHAHRARLAVSAIGDAALGLALTVAAIPLWLQLSMVEECRSRVEQALAWLAREAPVDVRGEMKLQTALGCVAAVYQRCNPAADRPVLWLSACGHVYQAKP
jgi:hypothetical protein